MAISRNVWRTWSCSFSHWIRNWTTSTKTRTASTRITTPQQRHSKCWCSSPNEPDKFGLGLDESHLSVSSAVVISCFHQELTCKRLFRCIRQRERKDQFMAPQWLRESWTTTVPTLTIKQHFHRFMKLEATPNLQNKSPQRRLDHQQAPKIEKPKEIDPLSSGENEILFSVKTLMEKDTSENSMILLKSLKPQKPGKRW